MKLLKYAGWSVGGLLLLALAGGIGLWMYFDPNDYKGEVQRLVKDRTGRELALPGRISLSLFPDIALEFGPAMLGDASGFGTEPMLQLERVRLGVKLRPLFSKRVEVSSAEVIRPALRLQVDGSGRDNWSDMGEHMKSAQQPASESGAPLTVQIASLKITDGSLNYRDARDASSVALAGLNVSTGELADGKPVQVDVRFSYSHSQAKGPGTQPLTADVRWRSTLTTNLTQQRYRLDSPLIEMLARGGSFPEQGLPVVLRSPSLDLDLQQQTLQWPGLQADVAGATIHAELTGRSIVDGPEFSGTVVLAELSLRDWMPKFGITAPLTADATVLKRFALRGGFNGSARHLRISDLDVQLDDSSLSGSVELVDPDSMAMQFDLQVNRFNADRYLEPAAAPAKAAAGAKRSPAVEIPVDALRALNMHGSLRVAQATFAGMRFSGLRIGVDAARGRVHLAPLEAGLYGGQYRGDIVLDAGALPRASFNEQITGVDFAALAKDWLDTDKLSGRGNLSIKANATGKDSHAMLRTLAGNMALKVDDGAIEGIDLLYEIRRVQALLKQQDVPARSGPARTPFTQLSATANISAGVATSNDLVAATGLMRVDGKGSADLPADQVDMRLNVAVLKAAQGEVATDLADAAGLVIPVRVSGKLSDPTVRPDANALAKAVIQQKVDEKKQELEEKLRNQLDDKLKALFGR